MSPGILKCVQRCFMGVLMVFSGCFKGASRMYQKILRFFFPKKFQTSFKQASRGFQVGFKEISRVFQEYLKGVVFLQFCFNEVARCFTKFQKCFKSVSRVIQGSFKVFKLV